MKRVPIVNSKKTIKVDDEDYFRVSLYNWYFHGNQVYTRINGKTVHIGPFLIGPVGPGKVVDHEDGNTRNNLRSNLRPATISQNAQNQRPQVGGYSNGKGVTWHSRVGKWVAQIQKDGFRVYYEYFLTEREAIEAYNREAKRYFGNFARLNLL